MSNAWSDVDAVLATAIALPPDRLADFLAETCANRPELRLEVAALLALRLEADAAFGDPPGVFAIDRLVSGASFVGRTFGPYRIARLLGTGGMGGVYLAERDDEQFRKTVAVKILAGAFALPEMLARFRSERQILATLDHPNIARLFDAGASADGVPYLVMEYVDGVPITQYCSDHASPLRARLQMFQTICAAVHVAHQHLVVHRDIKPGNVLVTADGVPKLLDFGIAKILAPWPEAAATAMNVHPMTPSYASPEQLRGGGVTTASDIYSLGVLLYELIAGTRPFRLDGATLEDAIRIVSVHDPPKPSAAGGARRRDLEGDLDAIALKALRKQPADRYGSAEDLSADIGRYLGGLPVEARRGTLRYVSRKFVARHRWTVGATAAALLLIGAGAASTVREARIATRRFNDVRALAHVVIFDLHDGIARLPGSTDVRRMLVARGLQYLDALSQEAGGDSALEIELAEAYARIGDVQGNIGQSNLGDSQGALGSYARARQILGSIPPRDRRRTAAQIELAKVYYSTAGVQNFLTKTDEARDSLQAALAIWEQRGREAPDDAEAMKGLASNYLMLGNLSGLTKIGAGLENKIRALAVFERLLASGYTGDRARDVALAHKYIAGDLLTPVDGSLFGTVKSALDHLAKARDWDARRVADNPNDALAKLDLSFDLSEMGSAYLEQQDPSAALDAFRNVADVRRQLVDADPLDVRAKERLVFAQLSISEVLLALGRAADAKASAIEAAALAGALVDAHPDDHIARSYLAEAYMRTGDAERGADKGQSCRSYRRSLDAYREFERRAAKSGREQYMLKHVAQEMMACTAPPH